MAEKKGNGGSAGAKGNSDSSKGTRASKGGSGANSRTSSTMKQAKVGSKVRDEIFSIVIIAVGIFLAIAIQTTVAGAFGKILQDFLLGCFGILAYVLPYYLILYGILLIMDKTVHITSRSFFLMLLIFFMLTLLNSARYIDVDTFAITKAGTFFSQGIAKTGGGFIGMVVGTLIAKAIGIPGLIIFAVVMILVCLLLVMNTPISQFIQNSKIRRVERQIQREEERIQYEKEQEEKRIEQRAESKYKEMEKQRRAEAEKAQSLQEKDGKQPEAAQDAESTGDSETGAVSGEATPVKKGGFLGLFGGAKVTQEAAVNQQAGEGSDMASQDNPDVPMSALAAAKLAKSQQNIIGYMKDDSLFGENETGLNAGPITDLDGSELKNPARPDAVTEPVKKLSKAEAQNAMLTEEDLKGNEANGAQAPKPYQFPPITLLNKSKNDDKNVDMILREKAMKLEETLRNFHVDAKVVDVTQGPAVTRYEIQPAVGVKVSSIVRLADDIALNLEAKSIRMEAPIPGKAAVGIEVENDKINFVNLRDIIDSKNFKEAKSKISFAVGKDISGNAIVGDLKSMPHMLIAGSTGSGKSVCVNSIILSILYKAKPEEVKLVLIDPKVVELGNYNGIQHLLIPVVTEPGKAAAALNWAVAEMTDRYKKFADEGVRDLESFNETVTKKGENDRFMPQVVIIIDELADLMMAAPSQVEESICRLAQMARAAGMHLIVATQRPSVDVVTGVIKANIPSRIAFAVSSQVDSRTIIDMSGAEKLVGKGDMLYNPLGSGKPLRVQGAFVSDSEVHSVIEFVKSQGAPGEYSQDVIHTIERSNAPEQHDDDGDELLEEAIEAVVQSGQASVSMLQRRFRIGYNRAARIVDMMEARGIIGPADGSRPRQVLMNQEELAELKEITADLAEGKQQ